MSDRLTPEELRRIANALDDLTKIQREWDVVVSAHAGLHLQLGEAQLRVEWFEQGDKAYYRLVVDSE